MSDHRDIDHTETDHYKSDPSRSDHPKSDHSKADHYKADASSAASSKLPGSSVLTDGSRLASRHRATSPTNPFTPFPADEVEQSIVARFEAQAALHAQALAISDGALRWTYAELNARSNRIAGALLAKAPAASDHPVALLFEHGGPAIAAM